MNISYKVYEIKEDPKYTYNVNIWPQTVLYEVGGYNSTLKEAEDYIAKQKPNKTYTILPIYQSY